MKRSLAVLAGLVALVAALVTQRSAQAVHALPAAQVVSTTEYLIALPMPDAETLDVPANLTREQAVEYARRIMYRQAQPWLAELKRLKDSGQIAGFELRPELYAIAVQIDRSQDAASALAHFSAETFIAAADQPTPSCIAGASEALIDQVLGLSQRPRLAGSHAALNALATNPSIDVYMPPGAQPGTWTYVTGLTSPSTTVSLRILRGGSVVGTATKTSDSSGRYYFYPSYLSCPTSGYNWTLQANDVVEVTAAGTTVSTIVVNIAAWVDPVANTVGGTTAAGRSADVRLYYWGNDPCTSTAYPLTVPTDGSGAFSAHYTTPDFDRKSSATIYARDGNGNSTYYYFYAYRIAAEFNDDSIYGYLKPQVGFTATLSRLGSVVSSLSGTSSATGYYWGYFSSIIQPGDVIQVSGGGVSIQLVATSLNAALNATTDQAAGTTGAGRLVQAYFYRQDYWGSVPLVTACSYDSHCANVIANGAGSFALPASFDVRRGDYAEIYIYEAEGNYQYVGESHATAVVAIPNWQQVEGFWANLYTDQVTVTLRTGGGTLKSTNTAYLDSYDGKFSAYMSGSMLPTDRVEVTDGVTTETLTVQNFTARFDGGAGHLTGSVNSGHVLAQLTDFRRDYYEWWDYCSEGDPTAGAYDLTFSGALPSAQDYGSVWNTSPEGHYLYYTDVNAFSINAFKDDNDIWGYTETAGAAVTLTLRTGATIKAITTTISSDDGYYETYLAAASPVTIAQGDTVQVQTGDGDNATLNIPELTVQRDTTNNRVYGRAPANEPVVPYLKRRYNQGWYGTFYSAAANASGDYSIGFNNNYWRRNSICYAVQVGHPCAQAGVYYFNAAGHRVTQEDPYPPAAGADSYETDNTSAAAQPYTGSQHHTFHVGADTDWISITVPIADVTNSIPYRIDTFNLGWGAATQVSLYDTDGTSLLTTWYGYEYQGRGVSANWVFGAAGTYYLKVSPRILGMPAIAMPFTI